jgi:hypothetical protein
VRDAKNTGTFHKLVVMDISVLFENSHQFVCDAAIPFCSREQEGTKVLDFSGDLIFRFLKKMTENCQRALEDKFVVLFEVFISQFSYLKMVDVFEKGMIIFRLSTGVLKKSLLLKGWPELKTIEKRIKHKIARISFKFEEIHFLMIVLKCGTFQFVDCFGISTLGFLDVILLKESLFLLFMDCICILDHHRQ